MNLNNLFEGAIDDLEKRRIEDLEMKMDDLAARAKESKDPKVIAALRQEFAKAKAERDSYHYVNEHGGGGGGPAQWHAYVKAHRTDEGAGSDKDTIIKVMDQVFVDGGGGNLSYMLELKAPTLDALRDKYHDDLDAMFAHASKEELAQAAQELRAMYSNQVAEGNPNSDSWYVYAKQNPKNFKKFKTYDSAKAYAEKHGLTCASAGHFHDKVNVGEGFQDFNKVEPYAVCLAGKPVKKFDYYEQARRFHDNWKKKLHNQGEKEKADKITLMPLNLDEGYHANTIGAMAKMAPTFKVGDAMWTRDENGRPVSGEVVELRPGSVVFKTEDGRRFRAPEGRVMKRVHEGSMADASHHETGPKFSGYYKGTQIGAPKPGQSFGAESVETPQPRNFVAKNMKSAGSGQHKDAKRAMKQGDVKHKAKAIPVDEGEKVDRMVKHITKSEKATGKSKKDAEAIAWATANKRGMLDNANKKDESMNFMEWAVAQGSRFNNFASNPEVYAQAKEAYVAEGMSNALSNITRRIAQPVNAKTIIKNREQKKKTIKTQNFAEDEDQLDEIKKGQKDSNGNSSCWTGYHAAGTKKGKNGGQVRNCVPNESVEEDWQKANKKDKTDGMSQKAVNAYKRENPGSKLKTAVTTKPSKLKKGSKDSKRRSSYCARSKGQKDMHNIDCSKTPDKAICKARKRWNCESQEQFDAMLREATEKSELQPGQYYVWTVYFDDGTNTRVKVTKDTFDPKAYYAKQNKVVVNVDYDWTPKNG